MRIDRTRYAIAGLKDLISVIEGNNLTMVELGCNIGKSTRIFAESGKFGKIHAVDYWVHNDYDPFMDEVGEFGDLIETHKMHTDQAADAFREGSLDFVYHDSEHSYNRLKKDIDLWGKKVRVGGYFGGHDHFSRNNKGVCAAVRAYMGFPVTFSDNSFLMRKGLNGWETPIVRQEAWSEQVKKVPNPNPDHL